jgi:protoporphyrinogen oxidase
VKRSSGPIGWINFSNKTEHIYVWGAGVTGLLFGYYLKKNGFNFTILEKKNRAGGLIETKDTAFGPAETAANAIFADENFLILLKELKLDYIKAKSSLKKKIFRNNKFTTFPLSFFEIIKIFFRLFRKINYHSNMSVYDFFFPLVGKRVCLEVLASALNGIYSAPIKELHFESIFGISPKSKTYFGFLREYKKFKKTNIKPYSISFSKGMQAFISRLENELKEHIILDHDKSFNQFERNIICTSAKDAASIINDNNISNLLEKIEYSSLNTTTVFSKNRIHDLQESFGVLFPYNEDSSLGILHNSAIFNNRVKDSTYSSYTFISKNDKNLDPYKYLQSEIESFPTSWKKALPIYNLERIKTISKIRATFYTNQSQLMLHGNYVHGISLRQIHNNILEVFK